MQIHFHKYQGAGNDFIMIDNKMNSFPRENKALIAQLCHRNFGIGADGLILLENDTETDFKMRYYNSDGSESTMCGNGGRCIVAFAHLLGVFKEKTTFIAVDGLHHATIKEGIVSLQMIDVNKIEKKTETSFFTNTGSPHHVEMVHNLETFDVNTEGRRIRNEIYAKEGSNVNFVEKVNNDTFKVRTYERGVENETLACGTGATAVAIAMHFNKNTNSNTIKLPVKGGNLSVSFTKENETYTNIFLTGPAEFVFKGTFEY